MKIFASVALAMTVLTITTTTTSGAPAPEPISGDAISGDAVGGLLKSLTGAIPLGNLAHVAASGSPVKGSSSLLEKRCDHGCPSDGRELHDRHIQGNHHHRHQSRQGHHGRSPYSDNAEAVINALVNVNTKIVAKALLKLKVDLCSDIHAKVKVLASGLLTLNTDLSLPKIQAKIDVETNAAVNTKVDLDAHVLVLNKVRKHAHTSIKKHCPRGADHHCLRKHGRNIVRDVETLVRLDVEHLFLALKTNLMTHVQAKVQVAVNDLGLNLLLEKIHVQAVVDVVAQLSVHLDLCSHIIIKGLHVSVLPAALSVIRTITGGR